MDPFNFPQVGDSRAVGSKFGSTSGTSTDIIYPVSKLVDDSFQPGRTLEFNFKSDQHRFVSLRNSRLMVEYELQFGETNETCVDAIVGPVDNTTAPPSRSLRMTSMPNAALFDSQVRSVVNNVVLDQTNNYYDVAQAQLLTTSNIEGSSTSGSNALISLRKDSGVPSGLLFGQQGASVTGQGDGYEILPVVAAPYVTKSDGSRAAPTDPGVAGSFQSLIEGADLDTTVLERGITLAQTKDSNVIHMTLSSTEATAKAEYHALRQIKPSGHVGRVTCTAFDDGAGDTTTNDVFYSALEDAKTGTLEFAHIRHVTFEAFGAGPHADKKIALHTDRMLRKAIDDEDDKTTTLKVELSSIANRNVGVDPQAEGVDSASVNAVAQTLAVKVKSDAGKATSPNPKADILQQGYHPASKKCHVQVSEPVMLPTWQHPWAMGPSQFSLFMTISPNYLKDLLFDPSGAYGGNAGACIPYGATLDTSQLTKGCCAVAIKNVSLQVAYIHPVEPYIPKSISVRYNPIMVAKRQLRSASIQETFVVSPATRAIYVFLVQDLHHLCVDNELDGRAKAGSGVNCLGSSSAAGRFLYDSRAQQLIRDEDIDPRAPSAFGATSPVDAAKTNTTSPLPLEANAAVAVEQTAPFCLTSLQVQLGGQIQPREMLSEMSPSTGKMSRAWGLYTEFIAKSHGFRGSVMTFAEFCGYTNASYNSGPRCGSRGSFFMFNIQNPSGTLSTDLQIRGQLEGTPDDLAKQQMIVMAVSESMMDISWQAPSSAPVLTRTQPLS